MEREVGGGIGMGNTCKPMAVSFQCMTKFTTKKKKKTLVLDYQVSELYQAKYYLIHQVLNRDIYTEAVFCH